MLGGFGRVPAVDQLIGLRSGLLQAANDADAVIDLIASLPATDFCHSDTLYAALARPAWTATTRATK